MKANLFTVLCALAASLCIIAPAKANEQAGVKCPDGTKSEITNGNKHLTCSKQVTYKLASICSPIVFRTILPSFTGNIVMEPTGRDQCLAVGTGTKTNAVMAPPQLGMPAADKFHIVINQSGPDHFEAVVSEFFFPQGALIPYVGDKSKGVSCPAGFDGDVKFDGKGIRCDKIVRDQVSADCDFGFTLRQDDRGNEDRCLGISEGPTKPKGITFIQLQAENALPNIQWFLRKANGADSWQKKSFAFPNASL